MGVDLESGAPGSPSARYTIVAVNGEGKFLYKKEHVTLPRLIRILWEVKPRALAFDNVFEIGEDSGKVARVISMMPPDTLIIQVTFQDGLFIDMREAARRAGIKVESGKLTPARTAYLAALLASKGYGTPLRVVEEKTIIVVSRGRSGSSGGWSQQRYQRRIRASVASAVNMIKEVLDREGLDYDLQYRRSKGGIESAFFTVYASPSRVKTLLKGFKGDNDVMVRVKHVYKSKLLIPGINESGGKRYLILGIDPGITTGIAILDMNGNLLYIDSGRNLDRSRIAEIARSFGKPVIVAVDVAEPPDLAKKLASLWNATLFTPPQDLSPHEKRSLASRILDSVEDSHARDALAAAVKAYLALKSKLESIERHLDKMGIDVNVEDVKAEVVRGASIAEALERAIAERLEKLEVDEAKKGEGKRIGDNSGKVMQDIAKYVEIIESLKAERERLASELRKAMNRVEELQNVIERLRKDAASRALRDKMLSSMRASIESLTAKVESLKGELESVKRREERLREALKLLAKGEYMMVRRLQKLNLAEIRESTRLYGPLREGEVVYVETQEGFTLDAVRVLLASKVLGVILDNAEGPLANSLQKHGIPVITGNEAGLKVIEEFVLARASVRRELEARKKVKRKAEELDIRSIVEEYRRERSKLFGRR